MLLGRHKWWKSTARDGWRQRTEQSEGRNVRNVAQLLSFSCLLRGTLLETQRQEVCSVAAGAQRFRYTRLDPGCFQQSWKPAEEGCELQGDLGCSTIIKVIE